MQGQLAQIGVDRFTRPVHGSRPALRAFGSAAGAARHFLLLSSHSMRPVRPSVAQFVPPRLFEHAFPMLPLTYYSSVRCFFGGNSDLANGQEHSDGLGSIAEGATDQVDRFEAQ